MAQYQTEAASFQRPVSPTPKGQFFALEGSGHFFPSKRGKTHSSSVSSVTELHLEALCVPLVREESCDKGATPAVWRTAFAATVSSSERSATM